MARRPRRKRHKTGTPVICPKCKKKIVFFAGGTAVEGDAEINIFCKTCNEEVSIGMNYLQKTLLTPA